MNRCGAAALSLIPNLLESNFKSRVHQIRNLAYLEINKTRYVSFWELENSATASHVYLQLNFSDYY